MKAPDGCPALVIVIFILTLTVNSAISIDEKPLDMRSYPKRPQIPFPVPSQTIPWAMETSKPVPSIDLVKRSISSSHGEAFSAFPTSIPGLHKASDQCQVSGQAVGVAAARNCIGQYHNDHATTISGAFGVLPTPRAFIRKDGTVLKARFKTFRPVGPNIYWLGLDENDGRKVSYPSRSRIREAFAIAAAMGANTVRSITLGVSTGHPLSVWPYKGETNEDAFESIDYAIATARQYGIRLVIPFTDNYRFYHGGKYNFLEWEGIHSTNADAEMNFYRNRNVIESFKDYIEVIVTHVNQFNGIAFKDDPTIMAWETGNELGAYDLEQGAPPREWTEEIANHIKSLDPNHLVVDGSDGIFDSDGDDIEGLGIEAIDIISDHLYPPNNKTFWQDHGITMASNKVLMIGEYDWTGSNGGLTLSTFYNQVVNTRNVGDIAWNVMSHDDQCCRFITHDDGYSIYYPNGNASLMQRRLLRLVQHWYHMTGRQPPHVLPAVTCPQPEWLEEE